MVIIKKYSNRRMYDTAASRYVNLDDVAQMVRNGDDVQVVDATSGEDLTRVVLTQIIVDGAKNRDCALPTDLLRQLVMASGKAQQEMLSRYFNFVFGLYDKATIEVRERVANARPLLNPLNSVEALQRMIGGTLGMRSASESNDDADGEAREVTAESPQEELAQLRRRLEELEARLAQSS